MLPFITKSSHFNRNKTNIFLISETADLPEAFFDTEEKDYIIKKLKDKSRNTVIINKLGQISVVLKTGKYSTANHNPELEKCRKAGDGLLGFLKEHSIESVCLVDVKNIVSQALAVAEGLVLGNYQFLKYRKDREEKESSLRNIEILSEGLGQQLLDELNILCKAVYVCRTLINEPLSTLNAEKMAHEFEEMAHEAGVKIEVLNKQKIEALKMGGLLAVNRGSLDPPTFSIMEYKPGNAVNAKPLVFVGKGIVYDTGGMNLKTGNTMTTMKCDMAGAAAVASALFAIASNKLPVYAIALIPATDNRPDGNAYVAGDIITMMDETTVEVLNTDAEGRLLLADALSYAQKYDPALVIDLATLTGAAVRAIGKFGAAAMQSNAPEEMEMLRKSGYAVYERLVEFPMWEEYGDQVKSDLADLKNIGPPEAGMITAGKFLEHFTSYPYIHLDIAGPAFVDKRDSYRGQGGTGFGVRLLVDFIDRWAGERITNYQ